MSRVDSNAITRRSFPRRRGLRSRSRWPLAGRLRGLPRRAGSRSPSSSTPCAATASRTSTPPSSRWRRWASRASSSPATTTTPASGADLQEAARRPEPEGGRHAHPASSTLQGDALEEHDRVPPGDRLPLPDRARQPGLHRSRRRARRWPRPSTRSPRRSSRSGWPAGTTTTRGEFKKDGDKTYWDLFAERTSKDVILQQDCGWTLAAGLGPGGLRQEVPGPHEDHPLQADGPGGRRRRRRRSSARTRWTGRPSTRRARRSAAPSGSSSSRRPTRTARSPMECTRESLGAGAVR